MLCYVVTLSKTLVWLYYEMILSSSKMRIFVAVYFYDIIHVLTAHWSTWSTHCWYHTPSDHYESDIMQHSRHLVLLFSCILFVDTVICTVWRHVCSYNYSITVTFKVVLYEDLDGFLLSSYKLYTNYFHLDRYRWTTTSLIPDFSQPPSYHCLN